MFCKSMLYFSPMINQPFVSIFLLNLISVCSLGMLCTVCTMDDNSSNIKGFTFQVHSEIN